MTGGPHPESPLPRAEVALRLLAHLGDEAARAALGLPGPAPFEPIYEWAFGIGAWGQEAAVRAACAAAELCEGLRRAEHGEGARAADVAAALQALGAWLSAPEPSTSSALRALHDQAWLDGREDWLTRTALVVSSSAMSAALAPPGEFAAPAARAVLAALRVAPDVVVRDAVRAALVPWARRG